MSLKLFAKYTVIYSIGNIAVRLSTFLLIPLYTHYLSIADYGLLSTMLITTQILVMLIDFGMMPTLIRFSSEYERNNSTGLLLGSIIVINIFSAIIITVLSFFIISSILKLTFNISTGYKYSLLMLGSSILQCYSLNLLSHFRAINKAKFFILVSISQTLIYLLTTILFVAKFGWGIDGVFLAQIIAYGLFWVLLLFVIIRDNKLDSSKATVMKLIKFGFPLIFARGGDLILDAFMLYTIGYFTDLSQVGIYSLATKMASILLILLIVPFQLSYEPYIYSQLEERELPERISKIFTYLILIFVFSSILLLSIFKFLINIIAPQEYYHSYYLIFFIIPIYAFRGITSVSQTLIHIKKKTNITGVTILISTFVAVILGYILISKFGIYAAILVSNLYWVTVALVLFIFGQKLYPIKVDRKRLSYLILVYLLFNICIYNLSFTNFFTFYLLIITLFVLLILALLRTNFFTKNEKAVINNLFRKTFNLTIFKPV